MIRTKNMRKGAAALISVAAFVFKRPVKVVFFLLFTDEFV